MDRFDIVAGHYMFCVHFHDGMWSALYRRLCRIQTYFTPSPLWCNEHDLPEGAKTVYDNLVSKYGQTHKG